MENLKNTIMIGYVTYAKAYVTSNHCISYWVTWIQLQGTKYIEGCVDTSEALLIFGIDIDIILITADQPYLVCEVLTTEKFSAHLHSFVVKKRSQTSSYCIVSTI